MQARRENKEHAHTRGQELTCTSVRGTAAYDALKRVADVLFAGIALALSLPFWIWATILIVLTDGWPVLYCQTRVGRGGRIFTIDSSDRLQAKEIKVLRRAGEWAVVRGDLTDGQRVCATHLERAVEGMQVQIVEDVTREIACSDEGGVLDLCREIGERSPDRRMAEAE